MSTMRYTVLGKYLPSSNSSVLRKMLGRTASSMNVVVVSTDIYTLPRQLARTLSLGSWSNFVFEVVSCGAFPCVYIGVPRNHPVAYAASKLSKISSICHGDITFVQPNNIKSFDGRWWFGWEYDRRCKWSIWEILDEVRKVIRQLNQMKNG